jgi:transposase InsO family protein
MRGRAHGGAEVAKKKKPEERVDTRRKEAYAEEFRLRVVRSIINGEQNISSASRYFDIAAATVREWLLRYEARGAAGLKPKQHAGPPASPKSEEITKAVAKAKEDQPAAGSRRIRDLLARFEGLGVSETEVRRVMHELGINSPPPRRTREPAPPRRFERARPMQMWQSDIFTFLLRKHQRLYLVGFMDDHSRFMVSHVVAHHQKSGLVMEALERGIAEYGAPEELLTDNGRQYTAWRGETEFEAALKQHGIKHIKSRPQHPMTLGKIERFWKTLWDEFLSRTMFDDFADCEKRIGLFIHHYNFQRPHQALDGLVPADRFFRAAPQVREAIEKNIVDNAIRLAHERPPKKPFYLVGRLGDRDLLITATSAGVRVKVGDEAAQVIKVEGLDGNEAGPQAERRNENTSDSLEAGRRRDGEAPLPDAARGLERPAVGDAGLRGRADLGGNVLRAGDTRFDGDADGAFSGELDGRWLVDDDMEDGVEARGESEEARARQAPLGEASRADEEGGEAWTAEDTPWLEIDDDTFEASGQADLQRSAFDPDAGFRGRALRWDRKLIGADEGAHEEEESELYEETERRILSALEARRHREGTERLDDGERWRESARPQSQSLSDGDARGARRDDRIVDAEEGGASGEGPASEGARRREREIAEGERRAEETSRTPGERVANVGGHREATVEHPTARAAIEETEVDDGVDE